MQSIDQKKLAAVFALLEGDESTHLRAYLALGVDPFCNRQYAKQAGAAAANFVRELARSHEEHFVQLGLRNQAAIAEVLDQKAEQGAVGVGLHAGISLQCVEGAPRDV
jgi:hypothetical protein